VGMLEYEFDKNSVYLFRITNKDASAKDILLRLNWYEIIR